MIGLYEQRKKKGYTQSDVAKALGVKQNTVCQWESGVRNPSLENVKRLAELLHCTTDDILKGEFTNE